MLRLSFFRYGGGGGNRFGDRDRGRGGFGRGSLKGSQPGERLRKPRWNMDELVPFVKKFYNESPTVAMRSDHDVRAFYETKQITIKGRNVAKPISTFDEAGFPGMVYIYIIRHYIAI